MQRGIKWTEIKDEKERKEEKGRKISLHIVVKFPWRRDVSVESRNNANDGLILQ
jgi:hypothetical protein